MLRSRPSVIVIKLAQLRGGSTKLGVVANKQLPSLVTYASQLPLLLQKHKESTQLKGMV